MTRRGRLVLLSALVALGGCEVPAGDDGDEPGKVYVHRIDGSAAREVGEADARPAWSPDGEHLALLSCRGRSQRIDVVGIEGDRRARFGAGVECIGMAPAWSPDGREIAYVEPSDETVPDGRLVARRPDGSNLRELLPRASGIPAWRPDGSAIAVTIDAKLMVVDARARARVVVTDANPGSSAAWLGDGDRLLVARRRSERDRSRLWTIGRSRRAIGPPLGDPRPSPSPDGERVAVAGHTPEAGGEYRLYTIDGERTRRVVAEYVDEVAWSPDGRWLAIRRLGGVELIRPDGTGRRKLASVRGKDLHGLAWSPDSRSLAFVAETPRSD